MANQTVATWKRRKIKEAAKAYKVKPETIQIVPRDTKRPIWVTWKMLQPLFCPINKKYYSVYLIRTIEQFRKDAD